MRHRNKITASFSFIAFVVLGLAAINLSDQKDRNLLILPKDISDQKLDSIMHTYNTALGVKCEFCHVPIKNLKDSLDYASDAEPMKTEARKMMRMVIKINAENFNPNNEPVHVYLNTITCKNCHRGEPIPPED